MRQRCWDKLTHLTGQVCLHWLLFGLSSLISHLGAQGPAVPNVDGGIKVIPSLRLQFYPAILLKKTHFIG